MSRLLTSLAVGLAAVNAATGQGPVRPKLVVGIMVDQLRTDYVEYLRDLFTEKGFRRFIDSGVFLRDVDFKAPVKDAAAATALVYSGAYPSINGIQKAEVYDPATQTVRSSMHDPAVLGNFTDQTYSPAQLRVSTLSDELAIDGIGVGQVFSIAPDAEQALAMTGHAGTSAFWIDDNTGKWSSTTYYKDTPKPVYQRNHSLPISAKLDTLQWRPLLELERYPGLPAQKKFYPFKYNFPKSDRNVYTRLKESPIVNTEVTDLAIDYLEQLRLGQRGDVIDMLNVGYTAAPWPYASDGDSRLELEDSYVRLDRQLGRLLDAIDAGVGLENALVFLSSTGYYEDRSDYEPRFRVPTGTFSVKRAVSLLNAYLSAKYGNGQYVSGYHDGTVYLDYKTAETHHADLSEMSRSARDFLCRMAGVAEVRTYREILAAASPEAEAARLAIDPRTAGDLYIKFNPGWTVSDDTRFPVKSFPVRNTAVCTPAFILYPQLQPARIPSQTEAATLAPTLAGLIKIRPPNGASTRPLLLDLKNK